MASSNPLIRALHASGKLPLSIGRKKGGQGTCNMLICLPNTEGAVCAHVTGERLSDADLVILDSQEGADSLRKRIGKKCLTVAVLPKTQYMLKWIELPDAPAQETKRMIDLEIETLLPVEYGAAELSFTKIREKDDAANLYEVYVAKQQDLSKYFTQMIDWGFRPDIILPTAFIWRSVLESSDEVALLVAASKHDQRAEAALLTSDGRTMVRTISIDPSSRIGGFSHELLECVRIAASERADRDMTVGWLGASLACVPEDDCLTWQDLNPTISAALPDESSCVSEPRIFATATVLADANMQVQNTANMVPRELASNAKETHVRRQMTTGVLSVILAMMLFVFAIQIATMRYESESRELGRQINKIKTLGEAAGRRIGQIGVITKAQRTRNNIFLVIEGLYNASPPGVSYSQVELAESGDVRLRGQANSVSLPILLPERLERQSAFRNARLRSAGQKSKGAGRVTEFRIDCRLNRGRAWSKRYSKK